MLSQTDVAPYQPPAIPAWDRGRALSALNIEEIPFEMMNGNCQGYAKAATQERTRMKVAIYTRVWGKSNRQDAANQSLQLIEYCQRQGWEYDAVIAILSTIAKQEHARLSERVVAGLQRAKRAGRILGRKRIIVDREKIRQMNAKGQSIRAIAAQVGISKSLVANILNTNR
jgi:DNA invertase Pin-like site-specific DNA recombinase